MLTDALSVFAAEAGAELTKSLRAPEFIIPTLALPTAFYLLFGIMLANGPSAPAYLLATYGVFGVMGPSLFGFGVGVATERERGWLGLRRTAPIAGLSFIVARLYATLLFSALALLPIYAAAGFAGGVALPRATWVMLLGCHLLATIPFALLGLSIGFAMGANAAVALANLAFLSLAVLGGLWFPIYLFPDLMQGIASLLPSYHLAEIALAVVQNDGSRSISIHLAGVAAAVAVLTASAGWCWSRQR